jgi:hypothetical protein
MADKANRASGIFLGDVIGEGEHGTVNNQSRIWEDEQPTQSTAIQPPAPSHTTPPMNVSPVDTSAFPEHIGVPHNPVENLHPTSSPNITHRTSSLRRSAPSSTPHTAASSDRTAINGLGAATTAAAITHPMESPTSSDSADHTLNEDREGKDTLKPLRNENMMEDSARSSMDHITDLPDAPRVSVRRGKEEFAALERRFSNLSQHSSELQRSNTRRSSLGQGGFGRRPTRTITHQTAADEEKANAEKEDFDLRETLRTGRQKNDEAGIKHKAVGVIWEDLEVIGAGGMKINIRAFPNAIMEAVMVPTLGLLGLFGFKPFAPKPKTILFKSSGLLKPGEMCLVLGRPGSGCSTFLKTIANQREGFMTINGNVEYAGVGWKEMMKRFGGYFTSEFAEAQRSRVQSRRR